VRRSSSPGSNAWPWAITLPVVIGLAGWAAARAEPPTAWLTGNALQEQLAGRVDVFWSGVPLRQAVSSLSHVQRVAVLIDRRVDPGQELDLKLDGLPLDRVFREIAAARGLDVSWVGPVAYMGPTQAAARVRTLAELRRKETRSLPAIAARKLLSPKRIQWDDFATPRDLLAQLSLESGVEISGLDQVPHDLWAAADLPPLSLVDRLTLIAGQFDLTFQIAADGSAVALVPVPDDLPIAHGRPGGSERAQLAGPSHGRQGEKRYTVREGKGQLGPLLEQLASRLDVTLRIDHEALQQAGISLEQPVSFSVENATFAELFDAVLAPAGCTFRREGDVIEIRPAK